VTNFPQSNYYVCDASGNQVLVDLAVAQASMTAVAQAGMTAVAQASMTAVTQAGMTAVAQASMAQASMEMGWWWGLGSWWPDGVIRGAVRAQTWPAVVLVRPGA